MKLNKIKKVECVADTKKVNLMLNSGWVIIETTKDDYGHPVERHETLYFYLGHEDANAEVPLTEREIERQQYQKRYENL